MSWPFPTQWPPQPTPSQPSKPTYPGDVADAPWVSA